MRPHYLGHETAQRRSSEFPDCDTQQLGPTAPLGDVHNLLTELQFRVSHFLEAGRNDDGRLGSDRPLPRGLRHKAAGIATTTKSILGRSASEA